MLSGAASNTNFIVFGLSNLGSNQWSTTLKASTQTITHPMRFSVVLRVQTLINKEDSVLFSNIVLMECIDKFKITNKLWNYFWTNLVILNVPVHIWLIICKFLRQYIATLGYHQNIAWSKRQCGIMRVHCILI